jgi:hypothetical protein
MAQPPQLARLVEGRVETLLRSWIRLFRFVIDGLKKKKKKYAVRMNENPLTIFAECIFESRYRYLARTYASHPNPRKADSRKEDEQMGKFQSAPIYIQKDDFLAHI